MSQSGESVLENSFHTPKRFISMMGVNSRLVIKKPDVQGLQHIRDIPRTRPLIVVTSHLSDIDVQTIAGIVGSIRDVVIASQSTNQTDLVIRGLETIAGRDKFLDVDNTITDGRVTYYFNPDNYDAMRVSAELGKAVVIAGHQPTYDKKLPDKPGWGAVYLAHICTGGILVPATLVINADEPIGISTQFNKTIKTLVTGKRPTSRVVFGSPITLDRVEPEDLELFVRLLKPHNTLTNEEKNIARTVSLILHTQAHEVIRAIATPLPKREQGKWRSAP